MNSLASLKAVTLRLPADDLEHAKREAQSLGISTGVYLRMLVRQSLEQKRQVSAQQKATALQAISDLLAPVAREKDLSEADILKLTKQVRKDLGAKNDAENNAH